MVAERLIKAYED